MKQLISKPPSIPLLTLTLLLSPYGANAATPKIDLARMGTVGVAGSFAGFDLFDPSKNITFDPSSSTLLVRATDGSLSPIAATNQGGSIQAACSLDGKLYVGGLFSNIAGVPVQNIVSYDPAARSFNALGAQNAGVDGAVSSLYCDAQSHTLWVGGKFRSPVPLDASAVQQYGGAVARYTPANNSWSPPPFVGLTGSSSQVYSITPNLASSSLLFGGSFLTQFGSNISLAQNISNPNVPQSSGATPFSTSLVPVPLGGAEIVGSPSSQTSGYSNASNILCPSGADGPGNSWRTLDGSRSVITVRTFRFITASGVRLGNTFADGRGAKTFSLTAIPDNDVLTLTYMDPATGKNATCSDACPLAHDSSVPYQDFLFPSSRTVTGFQVTITDWYGASAGLHILQLLSSGAFASAIGSDNGDSCYAPGASQVQQAGSWRTVNAYTDIAGTTQNVLIATFPVGTTPANAPSLTYNPYVSASGNYNVYLYVPGCQNLQDCGKRTTVKVTVMPGANLPAATTTISQQVNDDTRQLVYSGPIYPSTPSYTSTVVLALADSPAGTGSDGQFDMVADGIQFLLTSPIAGNSTSANVNGTLTGGALGFGFYEWPLTATAVNATGVLPNTTITPLDGLATSFYSALGPSASTDSALSIRAIAPYADNQIIFAGQFNLASVGASNVAAYADGNIIKVGGSGLNGIVNAMVSASDHKTIYVGGAFTGSADGTQTGYRGLVRYDVASSSWSAVGGGVNGVVWDVSMVDNQLNVAGNFTHVYSNPSDNVGTPVAGFASFDLTSSSWVVDGGFLIGSMTLAVAGDGNSTAQYIAGNVASSRQYGASGWAILENGNDGQATVRPSGVKLGAITPSSNPAKVKRHAIGSNPWLSAASSHTGPVSKRQTVGSSSSLPADAQSPAPAVLAGAYWTNSSTSNQVVILGGNFSVPSSPAGTGIALYDAGSKELKPLKGNQVNGVVRSLLVSGNTLVVGGDFTVAGVTGQGLALYDLQHEQWLSYPDQPLQASGGSVTVRSVSTSTSVPNAIIVAGSFASAGSLSCEAICSWDDSGKQWQPLGNGVRGQVAAVDYAGSNQELMVVGGALTLSDGTPANVAMYSLKNSTWTALGTAPGTVTAVTVNNFNESSIFAAGRTSEGAPFLAHWDGNTWSLQNSGWTGNTIIHQLKLVPLQDTHTSNSILESDRMLLISGAIDSSTQGSMSSTLYDGQTFYPYLVAASADGSPGSVSSFFNSYSTFSFNHRKFLATGIVILVSIAIATGIVFLLLLLGIFWTLCTRREAGLAHPNPEDDDDESSFRHHRPSSLLEHINAATRTTILGGAGLAGAGAAVAHRKGDASEDTHADPDMWARAETPSDVMGAAGMMSEGEPGDVNRPTHARYSFAGGAEGELPVAAGQEIMVLDDRDESWWYVRDPTSGREGVVPASYLY
ncbi:hypothetical protein FRC01_011649 [Tulasnella sp. 417]|nr:hypothetical protein FRC01_011649 [Tulasnella sp. 417]